MADITITATSVVKSTGAIVRTDKPAGETITAGQVVYLKSSDSKWWKAQCDGTAEESGVGVAMGIALNGAGAGQPVAVQTSGDITIGATIVAGTTYVVSATGGGIAPQADLTSTNRVTFVGYGKTTGILTLNIIATGVQIAE